MARRSAFQPWSASGTGGALAPASLPQPSSVSRGSAESAPAPVAVSASPRPCSAPTSPRGARSACAHSAGEAPGGQMPPAQRSAGVMSSASSTWTA